MTKQEAKDKLTIYAQCVVRDGMQDALELAIQSLTDPEWIPNTGTKPECEWAWVRYKDRTVYCMNTEAAIWSFTTMNNVSHYIPIPAPPEFVKKRRYVVVEVDVNYWNVRDGNTGNYVAFGIPTREAAQSIADIYEGMNEEQP